MTQTPIVNLGEKYLVGLALTRTDDENVAIATGQCRSDDNVWDIVVDSALNADITINGANGLDTGSVAASTFYALYVIGDSTRHNDAACLLSTSFSAPTLPAGYDVKRRVGAVLTDGSSDILEFHQYANGKDRPMYYDVAISELSAGGATSYTSVDLATSVPPIRCEVIMLATYTPNSATNVAHLLPYGSSATNGIVRIGGGVAAAQVSNIVVPSALNSAVPTIQYKVQTSDTLSLSTEGYIDQL